MVIGGIFPRFVTTSLNQTLSSEEVLCLLPKYINLQTFNMEQVLVL